MFSYQMMSVAWCIIYTLQAWSSNWKFIMGWLFFCWASPVNLRLPNLHLIWWMTSKINSNHVASQGIFSFEPIIKQGYNHFPLHFFHQNVDPFRFIDISKLICKSRNQKQNIGWLYWHLHKIIDKRIQNNFHFYPPMIFNKVK